MWLLFYCVLKPLRNHAGVIEWCVRREVTYDHCLLRAAVVVNWSLACGLGKIYGDCRSFLIRLILNWGAVFYRRDDRLIAQWNYNTLKGQKTQKMMKLFSSNFFGHSVWVEEKSIMTHTRWPACEAAAPAVLFVSNSFEALIKNRKNRDFDERQARPLASHAMLWCRSKWWYESGWANCWVCNNIYDFAEGNYRA